MAHPEQQSVPRRKLSISTHFKDSCNIHEENVPPCNGNTDDQSLSNDQNHSEDCAPPFSHVCECGQEFTNSGAYARHKGSKKCEKKKKHKNASKNVLDIRDFMNGRAKRNKNRTSSSSSQKAEQSDSNDDSDMSSGQMPRSDSNDNDDDDDDDNHRTHADDNHRTHPHAINTAAKWKFVLLDQNNEIVEMKDSKSFHSNMCAGVIPYQLSDALDDPDAAIGEFIPWQRVYKKKRSWHICANRIHHVDCYGVLSDPALSDANVNKKCLFFERDRHINDLLWEGFNTRSNAKNCHMNFRSIQHKSSNQSTKMKRLKSNLQNKDRKIHNQIHKVTIFKRIKTAMALSSGDSLGRIFRTYQEAGKSDQFLCHKIELYVNNHYKPQNMDYDDFCRSALMMCFSGATLCNIMHRTGTVYSSSRTRELMAKEFKASKTIITDAGDMTENKLRLRLMDICSNASIQNEQKILSYKMDEMWINLKLEAKYDAKTKQNIAILCQHYEPDIHPDKCLVMRSDCDRLIDALQDTDPVVPLHVPSMICLFQVTIFSESKVGTHIVATVPHCQYKAPNYTKRWMLALARVNIPHCLPVKTGSSDGLRTSDPRHNYKATFKKISEGKVKICGTSIDMKFIKKVGESAVVWKGEDARFTTTKGQFTSLCSSYKKDQMNVKNPLKFADTMRLMTKNAVLDKLFHNFDTKHHEHLNSLKIYSEAASTYIAISLNRDLTWDGILYNVAKAATLNWILFNEDGTRYCSSQNFYEMQKTCASLYQLIGSILQLDDECGELYKKIKIVVDYISSQSCELCFGTCRAIAHGSLTCISALQTFEKVFVVDTVLDKRPDWRPPSKRLDGIERNNESTATASITLEGVNISRAYKHGVGDAIKLVKKYKPQCNYGWLATTQDYHWLNTTRKDYERAPSVLDDDSDEDVDEDDEKVEQKQETEQQAELARELKCIWGVPTASIHLNPSKTDEMDKAQSIMSEHGIVSVQKYLNLHYNEKRFQGHIHSNKSSDRLKALRNIKKTTTTKTIPTNDGSTDDDTEDVESDLFAESDFVIFKSGSVCYAGLPLEFYMAGSGGEKEYHGRLTERLLNRDDVFMTVIPVKVRRGTKEIKLDMFDMKYKLNQTEMGSRKHVVFDVPVGSVCKLNHTLAMDEKDIHFPIKSVKQCLEVLKNMTCEKLKGCSEFVSLNAALKKKREKIESKSTNCSKKEPKKASKILNKKKKDPFGDTLRLITKANHAAPCTVCGKVIAAKDLYTHHSLHFATTSGTPPTAQCALSITPQFRYVIKEGKVYFEEIPNNARKALTARDCLICCSNQCSHYLIPKSKKVAEYAVSNCPLFYPYSVKAVRTRMTSLNASNPSVILPVKCSICGEWINSYLMELHLQEDHNKLDSFGTSHTHVPSQKHMELAIAKLEEVGKSKGRITKKWIQLCVSQTVSKSNAAQKTASEKYGMRSTKYNSKRFFSELSSTQHDDNISRNHNKKKRKLR
eukprot:1137324_1